MREGSGRGVCRVQCTGSAGQSTVARLAMIVCTRIRGPSTATSLAAARSPARTVVTAGSVIATSAVVAASVAVSACCGVAGLRDRADREKDSSENRKNAHYRTSDDSLREA